MDFSGIYEEESVDSKLIKSKYVEKSIPVKLKNYLSSVPGMPSWDFSYLSDILGERQLALKDFKKDGSIQVVNTPAKEYIASLLAYEKNLAGASEGGLEIERPLYCHDIPIFEIAKDLIDDVRGVDAAFLPSWYRQAWWKYAQFFMSPTSSVTPLHFDTLLTHNMFFQVYGKKEFIIMPHSASNYCYRHKWRWFQVDPTKPDLQSFPEYQKAHVQKVILEAGDVLYMPPGTLHHVTTIDASISFNVDFHTPKSALKSFSGLLRGMPKENAYYNFILFLGLIFKVPSNRLFPYYRSYLNYIS